MTARALRIAQGVGLPVALTAIWWVASANSSSIYFPPLRDILDTFADTWIFERFSSDLVPSVTRLLAGFAIAAVAGVAVGILLGLSARARRDLSPLTEYLRATPIVALIPVALILFGPGADMEIAVIAFGSWWPILVSTADGVRGLDPQLLQTARVYGMKRRTIVYRVALPAALPAIFPGLRVALALGMTAMLIANMYSSSSGLGFFVIDSQNNFDVQGTWAGLLVIGLVGVVVNLMLLLAQSRVLGWHRGWRGATKEQP